MINGYKILDGKPEGKKSPGNIWHRWKDNPNMDPREKLCVRVWTGFICLRLGPLAVIHPSSRRNLKNETHHTWGLQYTVLISQTWLLTIFIQLTHL
jgi:hypothetical protein